MRRPPGRPLSGAERAARLGRRSSLRRLVCYQVTSQHSDQGAAWTGSARGRRRACLARVQDTSKEMAPLARGEVYLGSCSGWLILMPGIPWVDLRCGGWRLPSDELKARRLWAPAARCRLPACFQRPVPAKVGPYLLKHGIRRHHVPPARLARDLNHSDQVTRPLRTELS